MSFNTGAALLDGYCLGAAVSREEEGTYGYKITQDVREALDVSELDAVSGAAQASER